MKNIGMTPEQIKKAFKGEKATEKPNELRISLSSTIKKQKPVKGFRVIQSQDTALLLKLPYSTAQISNQTTTPEWFTFNQKADVSIIVPLYNKSIDRLVESWDFFTDGLKVELIFVDDNCPLNSKDKVVPAWETRRSDIKKPIGKIYVSEATQGWGACCNIGAAAATANLIVFLHPNSKLFPGWLSPLLRLIRKPDVGAAGSLHVNEEESVLDAGKCWNWEEYRFDCIGYDCYNGIKISNPFKLDNCPADIFQASEREAISSSCMAVRKQDFLDLGGFSPNIYDKEWSDADFCLRLREAGLMVMSQPNSRVYYDQSDSATKHFKSGETFFYNKWDVSDRISKLVKASRIKPKTTVANILISRQAAHGDVLLAAAVAPALKKKYPDCKIVFATDCPEVLTSNPWIDTVVSEASERQFHLLCNLDLCYEYRPNVNILQAYAESVGVSTADCELFLKTEPIDTPESYVVIHAGNTLWAGRNWSTLKFDQISKRLKGEGYTVVCVGTPSDHKTVGCDLDLRGETSIWQLATVIKNSKLFIGIDSFPMHVAQTFNRPGVVFFGSIKPETRIIRKNMIPVTADGVKCLGCHHRKSTPCTATSLCEVGIQECINNVSVETMWNIVKNKLL